MFCHKKYYCFIFMLRKGVLLLTSSIVLQTNNSYFVKHSLVEKTKLYLIFVTLMFQLKTNQRQFNAGKIFIVEILICKSFVIKQISSSQITILVNNEILLLITTTNGITTSVSLFLVIDWTEPNICVHIKIEYIYLFLLIYFLLFEI